MLGLHVSCLYYGDVVLDKKTSESNNEIGVHISESMGWFLVSIIMLMTLLSNFAPIFGIPWWVFIVVILVLAMILAVQSQPQSHLFGSIDEHRSNWLRLVVYAMLVFVFIEVIWFGFIRQDWPIFAIWLPATLLIGVILYLVVAVVVEKTVPSLYLLVPVTAFLAGGLLWLVWSGFGYLNLFLLCFALLSFGTSLWLHFHSENREEC